MKARALIAAVLAVMTMACGDDESPTEPSSTTSTATTVTYTGTIDAGGSRFYSFTNSAAGSVTAFLASVPATTASRLPVAVPLEIGVGVPAGTDCATTTTQIVAPGLVSQMTVSLAAGVFCLRVADAGELRAPVTFAVRFSHP
jgi:hypothetical protein